MAAYRVGFAGFHRLRSSSPRQQLGFDGWRREQSIYSNSSMFIPHIVGDAGTYLPQLQ